MSELTLLEAEDIELPYEDIIVDEPEEEEAPEAIAPAEEPLFVWLLRQAVETAAPHDAVLRDYVDHVAGPLSEHLAAAPAKGGQVFIAERLAEGKTAADVARYRREQSMRAHLVNGLLPAARIARALAAWDAPRFNQWDDTLYRLFCAGYTLHDWVKLPEVEAELAARGLSHDRANAARDLPAFEDMFRRWGAKLGLPGFLEPIGGLEQWLHEIIFLAVNTQVKWGTMLNFSALPDLRLPGRARQLATELCTLADRIAYIARTPVEAATSASLAEPLRLLSDGSAHLAYHHVAELRGVLTNFIHNAALAARQSDDCLPLLFAPSGVVYLTRGTPAPPDVAEVADAVVERIRRACAHRLQEQFVGLKRDGKGLKTAAYYDLHLTPADQIRLAARGVFHRIPDDKKQADSGKRYDKIAEKSWLSPGGDLDLPVDVRVDQLAEFCAFAANAAANAVPDLPADDLLLRELDIVPARPAFDALNRAKGTGGVSYQWYYAAGYFLKHGAGRGSDPAQWRARIEAMAERLAAAVEDQTPPPLVAGDNWGDMREYVRRVLSFGPAAGERLSVVKQASRELARYQSAKRRRKATAVCSLCSSAHTVREQEEAGLLFMPQVYTNKQPLHGSKAKRNICGICEAEMMLRQILMNQGGSAGRNFENRKFRYIAFYPTYFFTPETLAQLGSLYLRLRNVSFTTLRKVLLDETAEGDVLRLDASIFQRLRDLLMTAQPPEEDRVFRLHFSENSSFTFFFLGLPPGRDAKDAEVWVQPAWLALLLPLVLDVKVVATESPLPLLHEADELEETVFLDAPHDFVAALIGRERVPLESLLRQLQTLTVAYLIHIDGNAAMVKGKFDYRWHKIPLLARRLAENPLWAAAYLKKWQRAQGVDSIPAERAHLYRQYIDILEQSHKPTGGINMTHARRLTELYRGFYRAQKWNSNSILRPIGVAARAILDADPRLFSGRDGLAEVVLGELRTFMERVEKNKADGYLPAGVPREDREAAMHAFADYFVGDIYFDALNGDSSALRGKQLNLLKNACEVIYRDEDARYRRERNMAQQEEQPEE